MAICEYCQQEMKDHEKTTTCTGNTRELNRSTPLEGFNPVPYGPPESDYRCHDCGIAAGGFHHPGCDMEQCPKCSGQLISCGCLTEGYRGHGVEVVQRARAEMEQQRQRWLR